MTGWIDSTIILQAVADTIGLPTEATGFILSGCLLLFAVLGLNLQRVSFIGQVAWMNIILIFLGIIVWLPWWLPTISVVVTITTFLYTKSHQKVKL
jgi:hypothetical protein